MVLPCGRGGIRGLAVVSAVRGHGPDHAPGLPEQAGTWAASSAWPSVSRRAAISPVSALIARCSLRHCRRARPCLPASHSPWPNSSSPVLSSTRWTGPVAGPNARLASCERAAAAAQRRMVRDGQRQPEQAQRQHEFDGQLGAARLPTWCAPLRRRPTIQRRLVQPWREVAAAAQARLIRRPVRDAVAGARDAMAAGGIVLERHGRKVAAPPMSGHRAASAHQHNTAATHTFAARWHGWSAPASATPRRRRHGRTGDSAARRSGPPWTRRARAPLWQPGKRPGSRS